MRPRRRKTIWDPVTNWDGRVTAPNHALITPDQMSWNASRNLEMMDRIPRILAEDKEANATPIGGMQYRTRA